MTTPSNPARAYMITVPHDYMSPMRMVMDLFDTTIFKGAILNPEISTSEMDKKIADPTYEPRQHYQMYVTLKKPMRITGLLDWLKENKLQGHVEPRKGSHEQAYDYCSKSDTRVPGAMFETFGDMKRMKSQGDRCVYCHYFQNGYCYT